MDSVVGVEAMLARADGTSGLGLPEQALSFALEGRYRDLNDSNFQDLCDEDLDGETFPMRNRVAPVC